MFCNNCGVSNPIGSSYCASCGGRMASPQVNQFNLQSSSLNRDFENEHEEAWDYAESKNYDQAEKMFRRLCDSGYKKAWLGLGFVLRDAKTPDESRSFSDYSNVATEILASLDDPDDNELASVVGLVVLPLARYALLGKLVEWANDEESNLTAEWAALASQTKPWIDWIINLTNMVRPMYDSGAMPVDTAVYFYETVFRIGFLVNDRGQLRDAVMGEEQNSYLTELGKLGFSKYGRWS